MTAMLAFMMNIFCTIYTQSRASKKYVVSVRMKLIHVIAFRKTWTILHFNGYNLSCTHILEKDEFALD